MLKRNRKKKSPNDYPLFAIRLSKDEDATEIDNLLEQALEVYNRDINRDEETPYRKNELGAEALKIGLKELIRRKSKP